MDQRLPTEILLLICSFTDRNELPNLRLVSKAMAQAGIQYLNVDEYFFFRKHSLERLYHISSHEVLRRCLRRLKFAVNVVPAIELQTVREKQAYAVCHATTSTTDMIAQDWLKICSPSLRRGVWTLEDKFRHAGWGQHQELRAEQEALLADAQSTLENIRQSLGRLTNIEAFTIDILDDYDRVVAPRFYTLQQDQSWYCYDGFRGMESFDTVSAGLYISLTNSFGLHAAPVPTASSLKYLCIASTEFAKLSQKNPVALHHTAAYGFRNVQTMKLESLISPLAAYGYTRRPANDQDTKSFVRQLLMHLPNLQHLYLNVQTNPVFDIQQVLESHVWPFLRILELRNIRTRLVTFRSVLSSHANSMRELNLSNTHIEENNDDPHQHLWIELLKFLHLNLALKKIFLHSKLSEGPRDIHFDDLFDIRLSSGMYIKMSDAACYLTCGCMPYDLASRDVSLDEELQRLTWSDLLSAYVRNRRL